MKPRRGTKSHHARVHKKGLLGEGVPRKPPSRSGKTRRENKLGEKALVFLKEI